MDSERTSDELLSDSELLAKIRRGEAGEEAAKWIEDLKSAYAKAHDQAMENGQRAREYKMQNDDHMSCIYSTGCNNKAQCRKVGHYTSQRPGEIYWTCEQPKRPRYRLVEDVHFDCIYDLQRRLFGRWWKTGTWYVGRERAIKKLRRKEQIHGCPTRTPEIIYP